MRVLFVFLICMAMAAPAHAAKAVFLAPLEDGRISMPPIIGDGNCLELQYIADDLTVKGGWSLLDERPTCNAGTCVIRVFVESSQATLAAMAADPRWSLIE